MRNMLTFECSHGYIPRNGITTVAQTVIAAARVFNMGAYVYSQMFFTPQFANSFRRDLSTFLAGGSVLFAGDIPSMRYSIGGADSRTNSAGALGSALGTETGLSGHLRFKEGDASGTRCDFYLCDGDNHNLNGSIFLDLQDKARTYGGGQYNVKALIHHSAAQYQNSRSNNPNFYFLPPSSALTIGATYFQAGFFSNGTIGFGGVANEASIASFDGAYFNANGTVSYQPEQIPPQGWLSLCILVSPRSSESQSFSAPTQEQQATSTVKRVSHHSVEMATMAALPSMALSAPWKKHYTPTSSTNSATSCQLQSAL
jgi:hypothetical protein